MMVARRAFNTLFLPYPVTFAITICKSARYIWSGLKVLAKRKLEVPVLDATAITVSLLRGDIGTAGSIMFLLGIGELLEEWTHKKSVGDLARAMALQATKVWKVDENGKEELVDSNRIGVGNLIRIHMGTVVPFDGEVKEGDAMLNPAPMAGQPKATTSYSPSFAASISAQGTMAAAAPAPSAMQFAMVSVLPVWLQNTIATLLI